MTTVDAAQVPNWHHLHISRDVIPALAAHGVTDDQLETMLVTDPRNFFARQDPY